MAFSLPELPYARDALAPHISAETIDYHHGKHHKKYVDTLNSMVAGTADASKSLEEIIKSASGKLFNQAAQVWNHTFYWNCLSPKGGGEPTGAIKLAIDKTFGSFADFQKAFDAAAGAHFGSGWAWLVKDATGQLKVVDTHDAGNPMTDGQTPLLTCDVWEHAFYIDYRNAKPKYLEGFWKLVNWDFVNRNLG
ncbi:MAG: superoxide dismutase [Fe] [Myxococcales bacterium]|nr:superoxide dismutase [Fe] [Myxococcales bacterium]